MNYYWGGNRDHPNKEVELQRIDHDPSKYDLIFIGTPVWAWAPAPPIYTFLKRFRFKGKKVAIFACSEGERGKTFDRLNKLLEGNEIVSQREFKNPKKNMDGTCSLKAGEWAKTIVKEALRN